MSLVEKPQMIGTVLVIDDDLDTLELTKQTLNKHTNFQVLTATGGSEALAILDSQRIDVIVLDYVMPEMDGAECFRSIKERAQHIPVIFLTGYPTEERKNEQMASGAFDYMIKPILTKDLILLVEDAFRTVQDIRQLIKQRS